MADKNRYMKRYSSDWAKSKSRDLIRDMIGRTLLRFRKPEDLKVLCFPGIDATEVYEVYDSLKIPRENIYGVEREKAVADELERRDLGIQILRGNLESLVKSQNIPTGLSVVSLDYTSPLTQSNLDSLSGILGVQTNNHLLLHQANLIKRDRASYGLYVYGNSFNTLNPFPDVNEINEKVVEGISALLDGEVGDRKNIRVESYHILLKAAIHYLDVEAIERILKFSSADVYPKILSHLELGIERITGGKVKLNHSSPLSSLALPPHFQPGVIRLFEKTILDNLKFDLIKTGGEEWADLDISLIACLIDSARKHKVYRIRDALTYSYISESGAPMIGDIYFLSHPRDVIEASKEVARAVGFPGERFRYENKNEISKKITSVRKTSRRFNSDKGPIEIKESIDNRIFLGSSARPVLTKQKAIEEFRSGASIEEVREKYRGVNGKPLAAWKAHVTMGTYGEKPIRMEEELTEHEDDSDLEKITKEEAIELISSGIPLEEIESAYPTSFSKGQLRAFKAHLTMGTYKK